jgi:hypothetical protein
MIFFFGRFIFRCIVRLAFLFAVLLGLAFLVGKI